MNGAIAYVLASSQFNEDGEPEVDIDQLQLLMDNVAAKNVAWSNATVDLKTALQELRAAIDAMLEGLN